MQSNMEVSYVSSFYTADCDGRFGRFHDWVHTLRDSHAPFDFNIHAFTVDAVDETLESKPSHIFGNGEDLWATKRNTVEIVLNKPRIRRELLESEADIIHLINPTPLTMPSVLAGLDGRPLVVGPNIGGWYPNRNEEFWLNTLSDRIKSQGKYQLRKTLFRALNPSHTVSFSGYHKSMLQLLGLSEEQITVLEPGVNGNVFNPNADSHNRSSVTELLYVGDLSDQKGYKILLQAVKKIEQDLLLRIVGSGTIDEEYIKSLGISDQVVVEGFVERSNLPDYYCQADIHVIPSIDETAQTNTQIESLACGTPIVATDTPAINEVDCPSATQYFWPRTAEALAGTLENAIENIDDLSAAATHHSCEFSSKRTISQLASLYESILEEK